MSPLRRIAKSRDRISAQKCSERGASRLDYTVFLILLIVAIFVVSKNFGHSIKTSLLSFASMYGVR